MDSEAKRMARAVPNVLVATPGRLVDHLQNGGAAQYMSQLDTFILDEADRLLDMGFRSVYILYLPAAVAVPASFELWPIKQRLGNTACFSCWCREQMSPLARCTCDCSYMQIMAFEFQLALWFSQY